MVSEVSISGAQPFAPTGRGGGRGRPHPARPRGVRVAHHGAVRPGAGAWYGVLHDDA